MKNPYRSTVAACYISSISLAVGTAIPPILFVFFSESFNLTMEMLGRLILVNFVTQLIADLVAMKTVPKVGCRAALVFAHVLVTLGMLMFGGLPLVMSAPYVGLVMATIVYSFGLGVIEATTSSVIDSLPGEKKKSDMAILHSIFCWGQVGAILITTLLIKLIGEANWYFIVFGMLLIPAVDIVLYLKVPFAPPLPAEEQVPMKRLLGKPIFLLALLLMLCAGASELCMSQWASLFAEKGLGVTKVVGDLLGPCLFAVLMGAGRLGYGLFGEKLRLEKVLLYCSLLCIGCYLGATLIPVPFISLICCALCGLSVCLMWPGMLSLCSERFHGGGSAMFAMLAVFGDLGCSAGPWLTGFVSDRSSLNTGLLVSVIFPIIMLIGVIIFARRRKSEAC